MSTPQQLFATAALKVAKPPAEVFEAIVDPDQMAHYFIEKGSGKIEEGKTLIWKFPEFDMEFPVNTERVEKDRYISFSWTGVDGSSTLVEITLEPKKNGETFVSIKESAKNNDEAGINWLKGN